MKPAVKSLLLMGAVFCFCFSCAQHETGGHAQYAAVASGGTAQTPLAPMGLTAGIVPEGFSLSWNSAPGDTAQITGYEIVRAHVFSGPYETVGLVGTGIFSFIDKTARPENIYFYKVRACAGDRCSSFSREASGEIPGTP
jgi:hypothetical protein